MRLSGQKLEIGDEAVLGDARDAFGGAYCRHACGLCEPACPRGVPINTIMRYEYYFAARGREKEAMGLYAGWMRPGPRAGALTAPAPARRPVPTASPSSPGSSRPTSG